MEGRILDTRFQLNVKGMTRFPGLLNIQGTITSVAGGTASEYIHVYTTLSFLPYLYASCRNETAIGYILTMIYAEPQEM